MPVMRKEGKVDGDLLSKVTRSLRLTKLAGDEIADECRRLQSDIASPGWCQVAQHIIETWAYERRRQRGLAVPESPPSVMGGYKSPIMP